MMSAILVGLFIITCCLVMGFSSVRFFLTAKSTSGEILRLNSRTDNSTNERIYSSAPVVRYHDNNGVSHVLESSLYTSRSNQLKVGEEIRVYYDPSRPAYAYAGNRLSFFTIELYGLVVGVIILLFGVYDYTR